MKKILLDTSIIIDFLRRKDKGHSLFYAFAKVNTQFYTSIITHSELYAGKSVWTDTQAPKDLESIFSGIELLPLQEKVSKKAGEIKATTGLDLIDSIIAATAITASLPLLTLNIKDFRKVKELILELHPTL